MEPTPEVTRNKLAEDLRQVITSAEELIAATANQSNEAISRARARAEATLKQARTKLGELEESGLARARQAAESGERQIREHPWTAVGVSAGIGFLLGLLIGRR